MPNARPVIKTIKQNGISVRTGWIVTKEGVMGSSGYTGRGRSPAMHWIPEGTMVRYREYKYSGDYLARSGDDVTHVVHTIEVPARVVCEYKLYARKTIYLT